MVNIPLLSSLCLIYTFFFFPFLAFAISPCNGPCRTLNDCDGQLICISGTCNDDPDLGTHICEGVPSPPPPSGYCQSSGTLLCSGRSYPTYACSPQITSSTSAILTNYDFSEGGKTECDEKSYDNSDPVVALSTGWYNGGFMCGKMIKIMANNGRSVLAEVVDECDSLRGSGCEVENSGEPPCKNNIITGSDAVWSALGLDKDLVEVDVTWREVTDVGCHPNNYIVHIV